VNIPRLGRLVPLLGMLPIILIGCTTTVVQNDLPCPERYQPILIPEDLQIRTPKEVIEIVAINQRGFKQNIKDVEAVAACEK